jgi:hyperosmotically inducible periplasmic protein
MQEAQMNTRTSFDNAPTQPSRVPHDRSAEPVVAQPAWEPRTERFAPKRSRLPGFIAAAVIGGAVAAAFVSSMYDDRSLGVRIDDTVASARGKVQSGVDNAKSAVGTAVGSATADTVRAANRMAEAVDDAAISAKVRTALAADPALSALKIDVSTHDGVVELSGPAPDLRARERAEVLAAAPAGVVRVDNRLVVSPPSTGTPQT